MSVAITSRDRPGPLVDAVRSALCQTYSPVEVVIVDHGSRPAVALPADLRSDPRVDLVRVPRVEGLGAARNRGVARCSGGYIAFLDDDDTFRPEKLTRQVELLEGAAADVAAVECGYDLWDAGERIARFVPTEIDLGRALLENPRLQPSTVLIRRGVVEELGGFDPDLDRVEDWDLWLRLSDRYRVLALPEVLVDRAASRPDPVRALARYQQLLDRMRQRIDALPPGDRRRVKAWHVFVIGVMRTRAGDPTGGRRAIWLAWRHRPTRLRWLAQLLRTVVGEDRWHRLVSVRDRLGRLQGGGRGIDVP